MHVKRIFLLMIICPFLTACSPEEKEINIRYVNGIANADIYARIFDRRILISDIGDMIYDIAIQNRYVTGIKLSLYINTSELVDRYGNPLGTGYEKIGTIEVINAAEVRKFKNADFYVYDKQTRRFIDNCLKTMRYQYVFE